MTDAFLATMNAEIGGARPFDIEILTGVELDFVSAGGPFAGRSPDDSNTTSQCSTDGSDEPGTS